MIHAGADTDADPVIKPSSKPQFGDYQANGVMGIAKKLGKNPKDFAQSVLENLHQTQALAGVVDKFEIAGPGFINIFLSDEFLAKSAQTARTAPNLGISPAQTETVVVDYSSPNIAKEMHVGHLRSTIIGDSTVRVLEFLGNRVIRANHVGDWGTQFGMLIAYLEKMQNENASDMDLSDLEGFYRDAKATYDGDEAFAQKSRSYVVKLQQGDDYCLKMWQKLINITMTQNQATYERLSVTLTDKDIMGESLYNPMLPKIVADLKAQGLAVQDDGAWVVYLDDYKNKDGEPLGVIVQKQDGGYLYTTTDIAAAKYRYETLHADRAIVYSDTRQSQHMAQAWTIARLAGFVPHSFKLEHHNFGMMLGKDGKPFKTRSGGTVKLAELLDEAQARASILIDSKNPDISDDEKRTLIHAIAIGAVKYADLSKHRTTDYVFDWDNMLNFEGNTAPYMQYAYTRIRSIFAKAKIDPDGLSGSMFISDDKERTLMVKLLQFSEVLTTIAKDGTPHVLCNYLYELAGIFSSFYEACPILSADDDIKHSRLLLADLTAKTLKTGLDLLGIKTVEKM